MAGGRIGLDAITRQTAAPRVGEQTRREIRRDAGEASWTAWAHSGACYLTGRFGLAFRRMLKRKRLPWAGQPLLLSQAAKEVLSRSLSLSNDARTRTTATIAWLMLPRDRDEVVSDRMGATPPVSRRGMLCTPTEAARNVQLLNRTED